MRILLEQDLRFWLNKSTLLFNKKDCPWRDPFHNVFRQPEQQTQPVSVRKKTLLEAVTSTVKVLPQRIALHGLELCCYCRDRIRNCCYLSTTWYLFNFPQICHQVVPLHIMPLQGCQLKCGCEEANVFWEEVEGIKTTGCCGNYKFLKRNFCVQRRIRTLNMYFRHSVCCVAIAGCMSGCPTEKQIGILSDQSEVCDVSCNFLLVSLFYLQTFTNLSQGKINKGE